MNVKAKFAQLTAKQGKTVMQFELDEACSWALPDLVGMAGAQVLLTIDDPQTRMNLDEQQDGDEPEPVGPLLPEFTDAEVECAEE